MELKSKNENFTKKKRHISIKNTDIKKTEVSNKVSFGNKGFWYSFCIFRMVFKIFWVFILYISPWNIKKILKC